MTHNRSPSITYKVDRDNVITNSYNILICDECYAKRLNKLTKLITIYNNEELELRKHKESISYICDKCITYLESL